MRFTRQLLIPVSAVMVASIAVSGCSGDKKSTEPIVNQISDAQYPAVQAEVNAFVDSALALHATGFSLTAATTLTHIEDAVFGPSPADSTFNSNFWTILFLSDFGASSSNFWMDSVQYLDASSQPQSIGAGASSMTLKHTWIKSVTDTTVTFDTYDVNGNLGLTGIDGNVATVSGSYTMTHKSKAVTVDSTITRDFTITGTVTNLTFNKTNGSWGRSCPVSGSISVTVSLDYKKDTGAVQSSSWTFNVDIVDGNSNVGVVSGSETASYTRELCTP